MRAAHETPGHASGIFLALNAQLRHGGLFFAGELKRLNLLPQLLRIKCPTLVIAGEDDPVTTIHDAEDIAAAVAPNIVHFERFPNAGQGVYRDQPEGFFKLLREFIVC